MRRLLSLLYILSFVIFCSGILGGISLLSTKQAHAIDISYSAPTGINATSLTVSDNNPQPNETVNFTLVSYSTDLTRAAITWTVNGKKAASAIGDTTFSTTVGNIGSVTTVEVSMAGNDGSSYDQVVTLTPATVDLLWQAHSYTPAFYKGKALLPDQADITVVAIPQLSAAGITAGSKNYVYTWKENNDPISGASGYGRDSVTVPGTLTTRPFYISVNVSTVDGTSEASGSILINYGEPQLLLYKYSPLYGPLYNQALSSSYALTSGDLTVQAIPYFFSTTYPHDTVPLSFDWQVNGTDASTQTTDSLTVKPAPNTSGQSVLSVSASNSDKTLQSATANVNVTFGASASGQ